MMKAIFILLSLLIVSQSFLPFSSPQPTEPLEPVYTQNINEFKSSKQNARLQMLVGCWLMVKQHQKMSQVDYDNYLVLKMIKPCMKKITRKDSVVRITALIGKNMSVTKRYDEVVDKEVLEEIMQNKNQSNTNTTIQQNTEETHTINKAELKEPELSEFDTYLMSLIKNYEKQLGQLNKEEFQGQSLQKKVDDELKKRQKYYLGFIPANQITHIIMLLGISFLMVLLCTCCKYYQNRKGGGKEEDCSHSSLPKNSNKMSSMTMKNKKKV